MAAENDDAQLAKRFASGDVPAFETLYARYKGPLYRYFFRQCTNPDNADELFQDVWVRVIKAGEGAAPPAPFRISLYQIAHACLVEHFRQAGRSLTDSKATPAAEPLDSPAAEEVDPAFASARWSLVDWEQAPGDKSPGAEAAAAAEGRLARLRSALDTLSIEQREAFLLHEEAQLGLAEIAAVAGATPEAVQSRLLDVVRKLQGAIGDDVPAGSLS